jgi:hypothetical protein
MGETQVLPPLLRLEHQGCRWWSVDEHRDGVRRQMTHCLQRRLVMTELTAASPGLGVTSSFSVDEMSFAHVVGMSHCEELH